MYKENFAQRLKKARTDAGYTQQQVSRETGISQSQLTKFETERLEPSLETLGILAQFYNVSIDWLLGVSIVPPIRISNKKSAPAERDYLSDT